MNESAGRANAGGPWSTPRRLFAAALVLGSVGAQAAPDTTKGTWWGSDGTDGTLRGRDALGNPVSMLVGGALNPQMKYVYDTVLDVTWLADWNVRGPMSWSASNAWAASLTDFGGGWALPTVLDSGALGCDISNAGTDCGFNLYTTEGERRGAAMAHLYYDTLGNLGQRDASGSSRTPPFYMNSGPFVKMAEAYYWLDRSYAPLDASRAWTFAWGTGYQDGYGPQISTRYAVAIRPGDIAPIPEPGTSAMLGIGVLGLCLAFAGRRRGDASTKPASGASATACLAPAGSM